ncbi:MAG: hypothetical protein WBA51_08230 [Erythrobacter sp.]
MREMGCMFMVLTFLAGITVSTISVALINVVVFFALSLGLERLFGARLGKQGMAYGMMGTFLASFMWPFALLPFVDDLCENNMNLDGTCTVTIPANEQSPQ